MCISITSTFAYRYRSRVVRYVLSSEEFFGLELPILLILEQTVLAIYLCFKGGVGGYIMIVFIACNIPCSSPCTTLA